MKTITKNRLKITSVLTLLFITSIAFSQVTIKSQGFDSATSDNISYSVSNATRVTLSSTAKVSNPNSLRFTGVSNSNENVLFDAIDISGYTNVTASIAFASTGVDNDEDLFIDFSYDNGATYTTSIKLIDGNTGGSGQSLNYGTGDTAPGQTSNPYSYSIPNGNNSLRIRVRSVNLDTSEYFYIDNVIVRGTAIPEINLQGNGIDIVSGSTTISSTLNTDFGNTTVTAGTITKTYTIENSGNENLNIWSVYTNSGDFSVSTSSTLIIPGDTATLTVVFTPSIAGIRTGTVSISNDDLNESTYSFNVEAVIDPQEINIQGNGNDILSGATTISVIDNTDFGSVDVTSGTVSKTFTIQNTGGDFISIWSVYTNTSEFTVSTSSTTIAPGATATLTVVFDPSTIGSKNGIVSISNNDSNESTYTFAVQGIGTALPPADKTVVASLSSICSGNATTITVASTLATETYQLRNNSDNSLIGTAIAGNGGTINLPTGNLSSTTTFNVLVTITATGGGAQMTNTPTVIVNPLPTIKTVSGTALICNGTSTNIIIDSSEATETYQLRNNSGNTLIGAALAGNDGTLNLNTGNLSSNTTFNVLATVTATGCTAQMPNTPSVTLDATSIGGSVVGGTTICSGNTSGLLTLSGHTGSIVNWESSVSPFTTWTTIANTSTTYTSEILSETTRFRAVVKNGSCLSVNSNHTTVTVNPSSVGGSVTGGTTICSGNTSGILTLSGHSGSIVRWERSVSPFTTWTSIAWTSTAYISGTLTQTTQFRAVIRNGSCAIANSAVTTVTVNPLPANRTIAASSVNICMGNAGNIAITSSVNTTTTYQLRNNADNSLIGTAVTGNGGTINLPTGVLPNTTTFNVLATITATGCTLQMSNLQTITVNPLPEDKIVGVTNATICSGTSTSVIIESTIVGETYQLRNNTGNTLIGSAVAGNGGSINLPTGNLTSTTTFNVLARTAANCTFQLTTTPMVTVIPNAINKTVAASVSTICNTKSTNITVTSSATGTSYQLRNNSDNSLIGAPITGTGGTINLPTGNLNSTTTFNVLATLISNGCSAKMSVNPTVTVNVCNPEINVINNGLSILDGDTTPSVADITDFGPISIVSETRTVTYTIENKGIGDLYIGTITFSGPNASNFAVLNAPDAVVVPNAVTTFDVIFDPTVVGVNNTTISIATNDFDEPDYNYDLTGIGTFIDTDGDNVTDNVDIDDDNDGILDTTENGVCVSDPFVNGSFENTLPLLPATSYIITPDPNVPGWQSTEGKIEIWSTGFNGVPAAIGNQFAELNANVPGTLYQTFCLNGASGTVKWSIKHRGRSGVDQAFVKFGKTLADAQASTPIVTMVDGNTAWGTYSGVYTIPFGQTQIVLTFQSGYTASGSPSIGNFIDDVQITITQNSLDSDQDGIVNILDLDDENDGIPDIEEAGFKMYSNNSSTMDKSNPASWKDVNGNGMNDYIDTIIANGTYSIPNTDGDSVLDYLDLDSDNDTLFDVDEAGLLNGDGDINGDGKGDGIDTDSDGILDLYDNASFFGTNYRVYTNDSDANGTPNYKQLDSNSDGTNDIKTGLYGSFDTNNDGKIDGSGDIDKDGITDTFDTNTSTWGSPRNLNRKMYLDFDGRNDYAQGNSVLNGLTEASIMAFIDLNSTFSDTGVVLGQTNFQIRVNNSKKLQVIVNGTTLTYNAEALHVSQWTHVGAIYGNGELKLYINGKIVNSTSLSGAIIDDGSLLTIGKNPTSNSNYFKGKIDEVRVFNIALSDEQLQRMVYQEIQDNSGEVRGAVIPRNIGALPFSNLLRYYRMDVYKDDIIDDLTTTTIDTGTGMKIFNHKVIDYQEAPLPFTTSKTGNFETAVDNPSRDIRGLDVIEYDYSIIEVNHNINETSNASDIGLVIAPGVTVTMNNDTKLLNDWYLKLDGKIDLQGKSQLIQTIFSELDATSIGSIERDQQGQSNKYNYNYWSSPVGVINNTSNNNSYTVASVMKDGTNPNDVKDITWVSGHDGAPTSPISTSSFWIYKFQNTTPIYANWSQVKQNGTLLAGQGYTMKGCGSASGTQNYTFVGKPNNGNITLPIAANNLNLCGNPYPSAIDSEEFLLDNLSSTTGAVYFWEHYTTNNTHVTRDYQGGYATRNLVGGTPPVSPVEISGLGSSTRVPSRFIPVGQGFLVYGSATGGDINFGNNQRAFIKESNANSNVMFKQKPLKNAAPTSNNSEDEITNNNFKKLRLGFNSANNYHRQILIGFMNELATSGIDAGFDAPNIDKQPNDMYFINNKVNLIIQGDGYFDTKNSYPLGLKTNAEGKISFTLDGLENFENNQDVFIYDNETNQYHNISKDIFEINLPKGTFDNRFSLRFIDSNTSLSKNDFNLSDSVFIAFTSNNKSINVKNSLIDTTVNSVVLFNMLGQIVSSWDVKTENQSNIQIPVKNVSTGTYIIKVTTTSGDISKKVIVQ